MGDLGCGFGGLFGSNPAIEAPSCWLNLNRPRSLYIACMGHQKKTSKLSSPISHVSFPSPHCFGAETSIGKTLSLSYETSTYEP
jgi:hypothetical protein